jgi:hypothetical protein
MKTDILVLEHSELESFLDDAKAIAWDTCHKIYVLMDDEQVALMRGYGYGDENDPESLITSEQMTPSQMVDEVVDWYTHSCSLRFIQAVRTTPNRNDGFTDIVAQGAEWINEDEDY